MIWGRDAEREMMDLGAGVGPGWQGRRQNDWHTAFWRSEPPTATSATTSLGGSLKALYGANFRLNQRSTSEKAHLPIIAMIG
jgi:hypothetical protein